MELLTAANSFKESLRLSIEVYHSFISLNKKKLGKSAAIIGDEGGFCLPLVGAAIWIRKGQEKVQYVSVDFMNKIKPFIKLI